MGELPKSGGIIFMFFFISANPRHFLHFCLEGAINKYKKRLIHLRT